MWFIAQLWMLSCIFLVGVLAAKLIGPYPNIVALIALMGGIAFAGFSWIIAGDLLDRLLNRLIHMKNTGQ